MRIAIIGCGNMGGAIASALSEKESISLSVFDPDPNALIPSDAERLHSVSEALESDIILIAVKPQYITKAFLSSLKSDRASYISIAAGIPLEVLSNAFPGKKIARFMPNIAAKAKKSVTAVAFNAEGGKDEDFRKKVMEVALSFGSAFPLEEKQFSAFIGISGSLIAYALEFVNQSAMGGVEMGIPYKTAARIVSDTLESAAAILKETGATPAELIPNVCSAAGTTIEGMRALADGGFASAVYDAVARTARKSIELETNARRNLA